MLGGGMKSKVVAAFWALLSTLIGLPPCVAEVTVLARTGQQAAAESPSTFRRFLMNNTSIQLPPPVLNSNGTVVFHASLGGPGAYGSTDDGVWMQDGLGRLTVMRQGSQVQVPGSPIYFWTSEGLQLTEDDEVFLSATITGTGVLGGVNNSVVVQVSAAGSSLVARQSEVAAGTSPPATFRLFSPLLLSTISGPGSVALPADFCRNNCIQQTAGVWMPLSASPYRIEQGFPAPGTSGAVLSSFQTFDSLRGSMVYLGTLTGGDVQSVNIGGSTLSNATVLWHDDGVGQPQLVARSMDQLSADPNGPVLGTIHDASRSPVRSQTGAIYFSGTRYNRSTGAYLGHGLFRHAGSIQPVAVAGTAIAGAPGLALSSVGTSNSTRTLYTTGSEALFLGVLSGSGVTTSNNQSILRTANGQLELLARGGTQAPGCASGQTFMNSMLSNAIRVSKSGEYAFSARLQGTNVTSSNNWGIWSGSNGSLNLALRQGMEIDAFYIYEFPDFAQGLQVNDLGHVIVEAVVSRIGDPWNSRYRAIIGYTPEGGSQLVAVVGQALQTSSGPTPTLGSFKLDSEKGLNDSGQVAFAVKFSSPVEDEGVVRASLLAAPHCPADFDRSGSVNTADIFSFLTAWFAQSVEADFDNSGAVAVPDIFAFLSMWFAGC